MPNRTVAPERLALAAQLLDEGWSFKEIRKTHGLSYESLAKYFPGRQWNKAQVSEHGRMVRDCKIATEIRLVPQHNVRIEK